MTETTITPATLWDWERTVAELTAGSEVEYELDYADHDDSLVTAVWLPNETVYLDPRTIQDWRADAYWAGDANRLAGAL